MRNYISETIAKYGVEFNGFEFVLTNKTTAFLSEDKYGIPFVKQKVSLSEIQNEGSCTPNSGYC